MTTKKQLVRATVVIEVAVDEKTNALAAVEYLKEAMKIVGAEAATVSGRIDLVKVSETGKQSRTKLGDVA